MNEFLSAYVLIDNMPLDTKDVERLWEDVVIHESRVDAEDAHQQDHVASAEDDGENLKATTRQKSYKYCSSPIYHHHDHQHHHSVNVNHHCINNRDCHHHDHHLLTFITDEDE